MGRGLRADSLGLLVSCFHPLCAWGSPLSGGSGAKGLRDFQVAHIPLFPLTLPDLCGTGRRWVTDTSSDPLTHG